VTPRAVFDTNVLISALLLSGSVSEKAFALTLAGAAVNVTSPAILAELDGVLRRKCRLAAADTRTITSLVREVSECVEPAMVIGREEGTVGFAWASGFRRPPLRRW
jgi:predicted nucleic acid-binding protein